MLAAAPLIHLPLSAQALRPAGFAIDRAVLAARYGLKGYFAQDATTAMQAMFDDLPPGAIVDFDHGMDNGGDYRITDTVIIRKPLSLRGRNSRIVGVMSDDQTDLIRYQPTSELRGISVEGLRMGFNTGGRDALVFDAGEVGMLENVVSRCTISGGPGGYAIRLSGTGNHFNIVRECTLIGTGAKTGAVLLTSADGNKLLDNVIAGIGVGVRLRLVKGAYKTAIIGGTIVTRDGGVHIQAGQQVDIERVQFEQGRGNAGTDRNLSDHKSHITIEGSGVYPDGEEVRDVRIVACNFGSGTNQSAAITLAAHARDIMIDENYFAALGTEDVDIVIGDASVFWTRIGSDNRVGGLRSGIVRGQKNMTDPKELFFVDDRGTGTYGVRKSAFEMELSANWTAVEGFAFWKINHDILYFRSALKAGDTRSGVILARLPSGFRPLTSQRISVPTDQDEQASLRVETDGRIIVDRVPAGAILYFDQLALPIVGRSMYLSGPY